MQITWLAVVTPEPAESPKAILLLLLVLLKSDLSPMAVLKEPVLFFEEREGSIRCVAVAIAEERGALFNSAPAPVAVFSFALVLGKSAPRRSPY